MKRRRPDPRRAPHQAPTAAAALILAALSGCESGFQRIDRHTRELLAEQTAALGPDARAPDLSWSAGALPPGFRDPDLAVEAPPTVNLQSVVNFQLTATGVASGSQVELLEVEQILEPYGADSGGCGAIIAMDPGQGPWGGIGLIGFLLAALFLRLLIAVRGRLAAAVLEDADGRHA